jgi:hypothetical protein
MMNADPTLPTTSSAGAAQPNDEAAKRKASAVMMTPRSDRGQASYDAWQVVMNVDSRFLVT